jgi:uncharacterized membrane protein YdjX (TVP38/TMEM64 family)
VNDPDRTSRPPADLERSARRRLLGFAIVLAALVALAAGWNWSPLREWLDVDRIVDGLRKLGSASGPVAAIAGLAIASTLAVPLSVMTVVAIVAFGPLLGFVYTISGACLGGAVSYGLGRQLGRAAVERLAGSRIQLVSRRLGGHGLLSVIAIRLVPIAPFAIVNMIVGASHISFRHFLLGTALGMTPGTLAMIVFIDQIVRAIREPGTSTVLLAAITVGLILAGLWAMRRWIERAERRDPPKTERHAPD